MSKCAASRTTKVKRSMFGKLNISFFLTPRISIIRNSCAVVSQFFSLHYDVFRIKVFFFSIAYIEVFNINVARQGIVETLSKYAKVLKTRFSSNFQTSCYVLFKCLRKYASNKTAKF